MDTLSGEHLAETRLAVWRKLAQGMHARYLVNDFGSSEDFWMNLQSNFELRLERRMLRNNVAAISPLEVA
ncbi:HigA family addiction module antitoxin [Paramicrobacterium fandaimingii]|uniref:HigA family addiction module antitoxin n=1 Tax=Paramicrobacterium fandaimingii TaxID=2708079 RepID=UPI003D9C69E1